MDYRINNEAIVACVIAQVVKRGPYDVPFVTGIVNLMMQKKYRKKVLVASGDDANELITIFGHLDGNLLGVVINSMTMLIEGECIHREDGNLALTESGLKMCQEMNDMKSDQLSEILTDMDRILFKYDRINKNRLYQQLWIANEFLH